MLAKWLFYHYCTTKVVTALLVLTSPPNPSQKERGVKLNDSNSFIRLV